MGTHLQAQDKSGRTTHRSAVLLLSTFLAYGIAVGQYVPPDLYGDADQGSCMLRRNDGQVFDTDGHQRPDVKYSFEGSPVGIALRDSSRLSFYYAAMHNDSVTADTTYRVDLSVRGAKAVSPTVLDSAAGVSNYYRGSTTTELVPAFYRGVYEDILTDIDMQLYGSSSGPRIAFVMRPGSDPTALKLHFTGQDSIGIDWEGDLKVYLSGRWVKLQQAVAYQVASNGSLVNVDWTASYTHANGSLDAGFTFGTYNTSLPLILQIGYGPLAFGGGPDTRDMDWSTYMGGSGGDEFTCVETDEDGNPYTCGHTLALDFPVNPGNAHYAPFNGTFVGYDDAVITKFNGASKRVEWATYYGGSVLNPAINPEELHARTEARKLAVFTGSEVDYQYVFATGTTNCTDFTPHAHAGTIFSGAVQETYGGGRSRMWVGGIL